MRDILFRGKHIHTLPQNEHLDGTWVYGYLCDENYINTVDEDEYGGKFTSEMLVDPETVCQYTGLADKNGRKIFEGDILHFVNHINNNEWLCVIEFLEGSFICRYAYENGELGEYNHFGSWHEKVEWKVIGNIYDNPELIGDQP